MVFVVRLRVLRGYLTFKGITTKDTKVHEGEAKRAQTKVSDELTAFVQREGRPTNDTFLRY